MEKKRLRPGAILQRWRIESGQIPALPGHYKATTTEQHYPIVTGELPALAQLEKLARSGNTLADIETVVLPSIPPQLKEAYIRVTAPKLPFRLYEHSADFNTSSLSLIYSTIILCQKYQGALPDCIYIASQTQADLIENCPKYTGAEWTGEFYFSRGRKEIEAIPVFPDSLMPPFLSQAMDGSIPAHYAIALVEN